jgi:hypothetical protein
MRNALTALLLLTACSTTTTAPPPLASTFPAQAPWSAPALARSEVPAVYAAQWEKAENRTTCALIAPRSLGPEGAGATPRAATFSGGWAVAYDLPNLRSAFGVAGTGAEQSGPTYDQWPYRPHMERRQPRRIRSGRRPEPNQLAYLRVSGQGCLYNIWSRLGREHLEQLIRELRSVR